MVEITVLPQTRGLGLRSLFLRSKREGSGRMEAPKRSILPAPETIAPPLVPGVVPEKNILRQCRPNDRGAERRALKVGESRAEWGIWEGAPSPAD